MKYVRVKQPPSIHRHPESGLLVVPDPRVPYRADDPLVKAFPDSFESDEERTDLAEQDIVTEVKIGPAQRRGKR